MPHYVYILQSLKDLKFYIHETTDVDARLRFHNEGLQRSTKSRMPFKLILAEAFPDRPSALKREKELKGWKGGIKFKKFIEGSSTARRDTTFGT